MSDEPDALGTRLVAAVTEAGLTLAVAESLTGGALSARFAALPDASEWFRGGVVAYSRAVKHDLLRVPPGPVVSERAAATMAEGVARVLDADVALAVTGVGGPDPQDGQEPGTVWMAVSRDGATHTRGVSFAGDPEAVVRQTCAGAFGWLVELLA
jgi:nicotinamide-nucleotide amidase